MTILEAGSIGQLLSVEGTSREVAGNTPFLLDGTSRVWLVQSGSVEVFVVRVDEGATHGMRHHFLSAAPGDLLFGMDLASAEGLGLLAVGAVGTIVVEIPLQRVQELAAQPSLAPAVMELVNRWVTAVSAGVSEYVYPKPRIDVLVEQGTPAKLSAGQRVRARKGVAWLRHRTGGSLFIGMEALEPGDPPPFVPVSHDTWVEALGPAEIDVVDTAAVVADGPVWAGLEAFHALVFRCQAYNTTLAAVDEYNRLARKAERERQVRRDSLRELAAIIGDVGPTRAADTHQSDDPLFLACAAIGEALNVRFESPPKTSLENRVLDPLLEIAKASKVRTRPVVLEGEWWTADNGPLLGYRAADLAPVALLPLSPHRYELFDPATRTRIPVTADVASTLSPNGVVFYPPFSEAVVTGGALLRFGLRKSRPDLWRVAAMAAAVGILGIVTPLAIGTIFDTVVPEAERGQLLQIGLILFVCAVAIALFQITQALALLRIEGRLDSSINAALMDRLLSLPTSFFRQFSSGDLGSRTHGLSLMRQMLAGAVVSTVFVAIASVFNIAVLVYYDWGMALIAMSLTAVLVVATAAVGKTQLDRQRRLLTIQGQLWGFVLEILTGISKLRVTGAETHAFAAWARKFAEQKRITYEGRSGLNLLLAFHAALPVAALIAIFGWMTFLGGAASLSTGAFLAFSAAFTQFLTAAIALSSSSMVIVATVPMYERVRPILDAEPEVDPDKIVPGELSGDIEVSRVSFRYESSGAPVLKDVSFRVKPGEFIAFVGPSGSGKSTLLRLLLGFEKPTRGTIQYDGQDLAVLDISAVRRQIGVVLQHSRLMPGDIFHNIVGASLLTLDDAWEAARKVGLDEDIRQMPMGMHTVVGDGGGTFSGGQRQRLLIARAIAQGPRMLFLDEATSALDNRTQAVVSESLERLQATRIVIAHRLSTVVNADRIYVLVGGEIVQTGTYRELIEQDGVFRELVRRQLT